MAAIRFFLDEDIVAAGRALATDRDDVTYVGDHGSTRQGRPPSPIPFGMDDEMWLPIVGENDWVVITRDKHIRTRPGEIAAVKRHAVKMFALTSAGQLSRWDQLDMLVRRWDRIEEEAMLDGPFICTVTYSSVTPLDIT